jgi:hypothetical protein
LRSTSQRVAIREVANMRMWAQHSGAIIAGIVAGAVYAWWSGKR